MNAAAASIALEADRQQALLDSIERTRASRAAPGFGEVDARAARGIEAYRSNAQALADRALTAVFPTVRTMVGADDFEQLAAVFWRVGLPSRGDLGEWGDGFPDWIEAHTAMAAWPWLGDCARLDLALHRNERAADAVLDVGSLSLLDSEDPERLLLRLMPGVAVLASPWPIATIHHAHRVGPDEAARAFEAVREALADARAEARAEPVLVARRGWRAVVHRLAPAEAAWSVDLLQEVDLGTALERAGTRFDFAAWLARALRESWLKGVTVIGD